MIMRKLLISLTAAAMMVTPVHAAEWQDQGPTCDQAHSSGPK